jgi:hypothetical protein
MSIPECRLAAEKEMDGKPFTVCEVGTWYYIGVYTLKKEEEIKSNAEKIYDLFGNGEDKSERGITLEELKKLPSNGGICIIPKSKDAFIKLEDWKE